MWLFGNEHDKSQAGHRLGLLIWIQYNNKYVLSRSFTHRSRYLELLDTIFIILRKKFNRVSTLHMYQKLLQLWFWYLVCKRNCGGDFYFPAMTNSFVNIFTYGFYLISLVGVSVPLNYKVCATFINPNAMKILDLHRAQFLACIFLSFYIFYEGYNDRGKCERGCESLATLVTTFIMWFVMSNMFVIFTNFHYEMDEFGDIKKQEKKKKQRPRTLGLHRFSHRKVSYFHSIPLVGCIYIILGLLGLLKSASSLVIIFHKTNC